MGIELYNQQNAISDDPYVLVLKLYEGIIKYLSFVKNAIQEGDVEKKFTYINKSIAIFDELRNVLDFDGGEVSYYLDGLYLYQIETLFSAGIDDNINSINQVMKVTQGLIDAWKEETNL
ncbi:flagellar export chaperone FliS [Aliarcobacter vitoriensis]|uniref:Flagellar protein FliS n=1 Tax=Aliarcobacter vitoriensis TaxID=2011099 RepID=A0A366MX65_9BACT|nr:flagellar export chaperone FliS [Aliarcobacter vitoriensis]RBQ30194.1 flagellar protein FliS [Aliarcobacter vitoriensis]RBQ32660.1 flagellar protein FliS [Arcobacter sp. FW59]